MVSASLINAYTINQARPSNVEAMIVNNYNDNGITL